MIRVEHWVVAERQGQTAALNMLDTKKSLGRPPSFGVMPTTFQSNYIAMRKNGRYFN